MGCISSKTIARSMSLREELLTSHTGNDQLFAFVCSTNKHSSSFTSPSTDPQKPVESKHLANSFDMLQDTIKKPQAKSTPEMDQEFGSTRFTRSKSCHMSHSESDENKLDTNDKSLTGSRSFHTVEEYDALLERIHNSTSGKESLQDYLEGMKLQQSSNEDQIDSYIQRYTNHSLNHKGLEKLENVGQVGMRSETGWKRKEIAKGLKTLDIPTIEFPAIARVKQWARPGGQVYSSETYVTPKFGSYNTKVIIPEIGEKDGENTVFSSELVAAFEDCMEQLQVEEDTILSHMNEH